MLNAKISRICYGHEHTFHLIVGNFTNQLPAIRPTMKGLGLITNARLMQIGNYELEQHPLDVPI